MDQHGTYHVAVITEFGCVGADTIELSYYPKPEVRLASDTSVCEETPLVLTARVQYADTIIWSEGTIGMELVIREGGTYIATGYNKCGTGSDTIQVRQLFCDIWVPNVFSPNGDGLNDVLRILGNIGRIEDVNFSIFNRWGEKIYFTADKYQG